MNSVTIFPLLWHLEIFKYLANNTLEVGVVIFSSLLMKVDGMMGDDNRKGMWEEMTYV